MTGLGYDSSSFMTRCQTSNNNNPQYTFSSSLESTATTTSSASVWSRTSSRSSIDTSPSSSSDSDPSDPSGFRPPTLCNPVTATKQYPLAAPTAPIPIPIESRQNPRRSAAAGHGSRCPPALIRQGDRRVNFVDNLVDCSTQIVETIWPLSSVACRSESGSRGVLPLRTFIQETLRRSRTSYSTLQVALYYLILVKPHVPKHDFTMEQPDERHEGRALQCGRRMFLSALILASKYLQDRNYSARAWSKISGLATQEIFQNELAFLIAVNWKLHITDEVFQRWTEIVLKHSPPAPPSPDSPSPLYAQQMADWRQMIMLLNIELDNVESLIVPCTPRRMRSQESVASPRSVRSVRLGASVPQLGRLDAVAAAPPTPKVSSALSILEPSPATVYNPDRCAPALGLLPTPRLTPQVAGHSTPAASAATQSLGRSSAMSLAMAQAASVHAAQNVDRWPVSTSFSSPQAHLVRRSSLANSTSTASSPESMISDTSRTSRSSSISSISSMTSAPTLKKGLAARFRCANLNQERISSRSAITSVPEDYEEVCFSSSPETYNGSTGKMGEISLETPLARRAQDLDENDAARALQNLQYQQQSDVRSQPTLSRKRSHPEAMGNMLQSDVRAMLSRSQTSWPETLVRPRNITSQPQLTSVEGSPRKRVCCSVEAAAGYGQQRGPGMWEGILN